MRWLSDVVQSMHGAHAALDGQGWPMDLVEARRLFRLVAAQGQVSAKKREDAHLAQCALGNMHLEGLGGPEDLGEARWLLGIAAAQGHNDAQWMLAGMHRAGKGGPIDLAEARRLFTLAAAQGHAAARQALSELDSAKVHSCTHSYPPSVCGTPPLPPPITLFIIRTQILTLILILILSSCQYRMACNCNPIPTLTPTHPTP